MNESDTPRVHPRATNPPRIPAELRERHPEGIYRSTIVLPRGQGEVQFLWRAPHFADAEAFVAKVASDPVGANRNLAASLAVGQDSIVAVQRLAEYPFALGRWVDREVGPFFGSGAEIASEAV